MFGSPAASANHMDASPIPVAQSASSHIPYSDGLQTVSSLNAQEPARNTPQYYAHYKPEGQSELAPPQEKKIAGLPRKTFWFIVIITAIVIAAGVGGGIGGAVAVENTRNKNEAQAQTEQANEDAPSSSSSPGSPDPPTPSSTYSTVPGSLYTPVPPSQVQVIDNSCPDGELKSYDNTRFTCEEHKEVSERDITGLVAYTLQICIDACAKYNEFRDMDDGDKCGGVVLASSLSHSYASSKGANCWLKTVEAQRELKESVNGTWAGLCGTTSC